jgi:N-glycosylase/DNA lyase
MNIFIISEIIGNIYVKIKIDITVIDIIRSGIGLEYKGYKIIEDGLNLIVDGVSDFNPVHIFECGQCFRWIRQNDGSYRGIVKNRAVNVKLEGAKLIIKNASIGDFIDIWFDYFDLGRDYGSIKDRLCKDEIMTQAIKYGYGIRLLRQDIWEVLISFIISANNRIPRIMKTVDALSEMYGKEIKQGNDSFYAFPDTGMLSDSELEHMQFCKAGFRCKYIIKASSMVKDRLVDLSTLHAMSTEKAREELIRIPGVGQKVADCVLLYSGTKYDVFPTDVWVKRVMETLYFKREASFKEIHDFSREYFGELAGFAQQYLFYYARENKIGTT